MVSDPTPMGAVPTAAHDPQKLYRAAWRWHFYAGLYVIPFFALLAITGMMMLWIAHLDGRDGERIPVTALEAPVAVSDQAKAALAAIPEGELRAYIAPRTDDVAAVFRVDDTTGPQMVAVDPYTAQVIESWPRRSGWYDFADSLHSDIRLGVTGDRMLEIAASIGMVLIATGLYMWWPRGGGTWREALLPRLGRGRAGWRSLHGAAGFWISIILIFFLLSGLSWTGIWGAKMVQAWSQFPAEKWDNVPLSDATHASLNAGRADVPWVLEQTPLPASGSLAGTDGLAPGTPVNIDSMDALARRIGFDGRYQMNLPSGDTGVYTFGRDSMNTDDVNPTTDRTTHVDRYTGRILADIRYEDYSLAGKAMAVGIALHMGTLGLWSVLANTAFCLTVLMLCVTAVVMWWKRRPSGSTRLAPPPMPSNMPLWSGAVLVGLLVSLAFPLAGLTLIGVIALDVLVISRIPPLRRLLT
ncbi:PepSY-associated TM helix domain-containing protein [Roseovarius sp.]|uniref:PepSY-associated TM helix domain-containing protein n=1 Tax=Roseovarius sp. TaxID=1486281 RepID=UPI003D0B7CAB